MVPQKNQERALDHLRGRESSEDVGAGWDVRWKEWTVLQIEWSSVLSAIAAEQMVPRASKVFYISVYQYYSREAARFWDEYTRFQDVRYTDATVGGRPGSVGCVSFLQTIQTCGERWFVGMAALMNERGMLHFFTSDGRRIFCTSTILSRYL